MEEGEGLLVQTLQAKPRTSVPSRGVASRSEAPWRRSSRVPLIALVVAFAGVLAAFQLSRPGMLFGLSTDASVYLGSAARLAHGVLPYRDYVFVQPPGIVALASPFGLASRWIGTRDALALLRLTMPLVAMANVALVACLARHRGRLVMLAACALMAVFPAELYASANGMLEPFLNCACLIGLCLVFDGDQLHGSRLRLLLGGVALGVAISMKLPAIIPTAVVAGLCLQRPRMRLLPLCAGVVAGGAAVCLPFFAAAPANFIGDVLVAQVGRIPGAARVPFIARLGSLIGTTHMVTTATLVIAAAIAIVAGGLVAVSLVAPHRKISALEGFALTATGLGLLAQFVPTQFYPQYAAVLAPSLAILLGVTVGRLASVAPMLLIRTALATVLAVATVAMLVYIQAETERDVAVAVDAAVPRGACTLSSRPELLVTTNRFIASSRDCSPVTDPFGTHLALGDSVAAASLWHHAFDHADYIVSVGPISGWNLPTAAGVTAYVGRDFRIESRDGLLIYVRTNEDRGVG